MHLLLTYLLTYLHMPTQYGAALYPVNKKSDKYYSKILH